MKSPRRVSISLKSARLLLDISGQSGARVSQDGLGALAELREAIEPKRSVTANRKRRETKRTKKKIETTFIREECMARARAQCEACAAPNILTLDHFFGRVRVKQSERSCWMLCFSCHRDKTDNKPDAAHWFKWFIVHATRHGYHDEARLARNRLAAIELSRGEVRP